MEKFTKLFPLLMILLIFFSQPNQAQERGRIYNIQAQQRVDGSNIVDVYYDLIGFESSFTMEGIFDGWYIIPDSVCYGDYGPGVEPGSGKYFTYDIGAHLPGREWNKRRIQLRVYFPMGEPCPGLPIVSYMGKDYPTIQIGGQCWLKENLNAGIMIEYQYLPWQGDVIEKYCYDNDPANCETYGGLYHWWEAMFYGTAVPGKQGICPTGFHIPTDGEFQVLINLFGGNQFAGGRLKDIDFWSSPNTGATNVSHYTALGSGTGYNTGLGGPSSCYDLNKVAYFWTSSMTASPNKPAMALHYNTETAELVNLTASPYPFGSVRCMKNCDFQPSASNAGPDQSVTEGNYTVLQANTPDYGYGEWVIVSGHASYKLGEFADQYDPNTGFYGYPGETYVLAWKISNDCTVTSDEVTIEFAPLTCGDDFLDMRNGKIYPTVQIGDFCWMTKNMDIGEQIPIDGYAQSDGIIQKYCYDDDPSNCEIYGGLYIWGEAIQYQYNQTQKRGLCPLGWFIPEDSDWCNLTSSLDTTVNCSADGLTGTDAGGRMKETGFAHWLSPNSGATNSSGFTALGSGYLYLGYPTKEYLGKNETAWFWSSTYMSSHAGYYWYLQFNDARVGRSYNSFYYNVKSARCVYYPNLK